MDKNPTKTTFLISHHYNHGDAPSGDCHMTGCSTLDQCGIVDPFAYPLLSEQCGDKVAATVEELHNSENYLACLVGSHFDGP